MQVIRLAVPASHDCAPKRARAPGAGVRHSTSMFIECERIPTARRHCNSTHVALLTGAPIIPTAAVHAAHVGPELCSAASLQRQ